MPRSHRARLPRTAPDARPDHGSIVAHRSHLGSAAARTAWDRRHVRDDSRPRFADEDRARGATLRGMTERRRTQDRPHAAPPAARRSRGSVGVGDPGHDRRSRGRPRGAARVDLARRRPGRRLRRHADLPRTAAGLRGRHHLGRHPRPAQRLLARRRPRLRRARLPRPARGRGVRVGVPASDERTARRRAEPARPAGHPVLRLPRLALRTAPHRVPRACTRPARTSTSTSGPPCGSRSTPTGWTPTSTASSPSPSTPPCCRRGADGSACSSTSARSPGSATCRSATPR